MFGERMILKKKRKTKTTFWSILKCYLANSSLHGVRYLVEDDRHWSERLFWLIGCFLSWLACGIFISDTIDDLRTHKIDITMDTNYLNWKVSFPAIHFCFSFSGRAKDYAAKITNNEKKATTMVRISQWISLGYVSSIKANISSEQFTILQEQIQPNCTDIFGKCIWNDELIDCCDIFFPLQSNLGRCLSFNSIHTNHQQNQINSKFTVNHHKPMAKLVIYVNKTSFWQSSVGFLKLLLTDVIEYPSQLTSTEAVLQVDWGVTKIWDFNLIPTYNDGGVRSMHYNERHCRFASEVDDFHFLKSYSYHGCLIETQMQRSVSLCNCVSHLYPSSKIYRTCSYTELLCIFKNKTNIINPIDDICLADCEETIVDIFDNELPDELDIPEWAASKLVFNALPSPITRYNRYTAHSLLDAIIGIGGTLSLFAGASVLSVIELFYWILYRHDNTT